jgi:hypothetical protein
MSIMFARPPAVLAAAALALAGCGNADDDRGALLQTLTDRLSGNAETPTQVNAQQVARSLQATDNPATLVDAQTREAQFIAIQIERNGPYATFASSTRQVVVLRDGFISSSRGFGGDLMSSDADALLDLVRARRAGNASYVQRFLTADDQTVTRRYACAVRPGAATPVRSGVIDTSGQTVTVTCSGEDASFTNAFVVAQSGRIIGARQWLGDLIGYVVAQPLRL